MEPLSPFISLPNEIVTQICEHPDLNKDDLIALRLTCKAHGVHDAATKALGRYFRDITVLFTRHSFQTLVDVCEHPVFGRSVRRIMLSSIRCGRDNIHHKRVINALLVKTHPYGYNDGFPEDLRRIQSYNSRAQDEDVFAKSGDSLVLLVQAFQSLARLDSSTTVGLTNQECHGLGRDQSFCAEETNNEDELWFNALGDTADMIATALLQSGLLVTEFNIETCLNLISRVPVTEEILKTQEIKNTLSELDDLHLFGLTLCMVGAMPRLVEEYEAKLLAMRLLLMGYR
ncbi:unnamed protein product [Aureobasidium pullulans]|nr:unnamed protein product [Aureobasidium pullulans]